MSDPSQFQWDLWNRSPLDQWLDSVADITATVTGCLAALVGLAAGILGIAFPDAVRAIALMSAFGGLAAAVSVLAAARASKVRDRQIEWAINFGVSANERLDASSPHF